MGNSEERIRKKFSIKRIKPSLEDVFIQTVEGKTL
jgi:hypothetical protein